MEGVHARHPGDVEATTFYGLALLATAPPTDKTYANQLKATALLEPFFVSQPNHPGVAHYLIHGYDYPELATRGLPAARAYAGMAPWVPHALHMPSHIFTRLGLWDESSASNLGSADASRRYQLLRGRAATENEELHALDYLVYAYLQTAQDRKALGIVERLRSVTETYPAREIAGAYALGTIPARYALERRQWATRPEDQAENWPDATGDPVSDGATASVRWSSVGSRCTPVGYASRSFMRNVTTLGLWRRSNQPTAAENC